MPVHDELGLRMKTYYEQIPNTKLMRRTPVIIRIDGKAFHTFTKGFKRPFDSILMKTMQQTTKYLCEHIQGCVLGYTQSDEISLVLTDYKTLHTDAWFNYEIQKLCSISASMTTMAFNQYFAINYREYEDEICDGWDTKDEEHKYCDILRSKLHSAMFDARCFNIPIEEVTNYIYWRQLDATRNSIQMVGQAFFNSKILHGKSCNDIQDMLMEQKNINWNNFPTCQKRGSCCVKKIVQNEKFDIKNGAYPVSKWVIDTEIPIFKGEDRKYIEELLCFIE